MTANAQSRILAEKEAIQLARDFYAKPSKDHIRVEERASVDNTEQGAWVQAWVWIPVDRQSPGIVGADKS